MTEEECKKKLCPILPMVDTQIIEHDVISVGDNISFVKKVHQNCIGSACMMYRHEKTAREATGKHVVVDDGRGIKKVVGEMVDVVHGYCGLAGTP